MCLEKVKEVFNELNVDVPDTVLDRAHRIGNSVVKGGKSYRSIIVRFTTSRHRTAVFRARKNSQNYKIHLDVTKKGLKLIEKANEMIKEPNKKDCFAFVDVNCRTCLKMGIDISNPKRSKFYLQETVTKKLIRKLVSD